ncbi:MAG: hypothetical protein HY583_02660, partial [Candidatus Omnitrophica bacterium]|nr:hypothetical protein [Candidatus Omnitrophota bacterium]
ELKTNPLYSGYSSSSTNSKINGTYQTTVTRSQSDPTVYQISAQGTVNSSGTGIAALRNVTAVVEVFSSPFDHAIFARKNIGMSNINGRIDSYNSNDGAYMAAFGKARGHIGTNRNARNSIALSGNIRLRGDAIVGPQAKLNTAIITSGNVIIEGARKRAAAIKKLDSVILPVNAESKLKRLKVNRSKTVTLPGGTYVFSSLSITEKGRLNFTGPAKIYVKRDVTIKGRGIGTAKNLPPNLRLYVKQARTVTIGGTHHFYGAIYAPKCRITMKGKGDVFGAIIGNRISNSRKGSIHFDEAFLTNGKAATNRIRSWQEL